MLNLELHCVERRSPFATWKKHVSPFQDNTHTPIILKNRIVKNTEPLAGYSFS
jgi:hypothetical protein